MKTCACGGTLWRMGTNETHQGGDRYRCNRCHRCITVRAGQVVGGVAVIDVQGIPLGSTSGRPKIKDWRHV